MALGASGVSGREVPRGNGGDLRADFFQKTRKKLLQSGKKFDIIKDVKAARIQETVAAKISEFILRRKQNI